MGDEAEPIETQRIGKGHDVSSVGIRFGRPRTRVARVAEAAKVWRDHIKSRDQRRDISMPPPPEFRPTVEKDQGLPVSLAHIVHVEVVDLSKQVVPVAVGAGLIASPRHRVTQPPEKGKT
jgi:hypothetical protein